MDIPDMGDAEFDEELSRLLSGASELDQLIRAYLADHGWRQEEPFRGGPPDQWTRDGGWWQEEPDSPQSRRYVPYLRAILEQILREEGNAS